ncbi:hypothetical protein L9F63_003373 [Diploptera punctata]|uniref:Spaetzle domain-containing protein n=1 Tax=Diploptera punctata TaxID=6984 RepID=A0AAD7ZK64_DIPPU|nr:hypothetical protein L9F63_003373 [Diploptera punctata]
MLVNVPTNSQLHSSKPKEEYTSARSREDSRNNQNRSLASSNVNDLIRNISSDLPVPKVERNFFHHDEEVLLKTNSGVPNDKNQTFNPQGRIITPTPFSNASRYKAQNTTDIDTMHESKIIFPGPVDSDKSPIFKPDGPRPKCADLQSYCEDADHYPYDHVRNLLENGASLGPGFKDYVKVEIDTRIQPDEDIKLCPSAEHIVFPKVAQNKEDKWMFVVNQEPHLQGVRVEKCEKEDRCQFSENFPGSYVTSCQQKYIYRKMLALGENGQPINDSFKLPSCCSCVVTKKFSMGRMSTTDKMTPAPPRKRRR